MLGLWSKLKYTIRQFRRDETGRADVKDERRKGVSKMKDSTALKEAEESMRDAFIRLKIKIVMLEKENQSLKNRLEMHSRGE